MNKEELNKVELEVATIINKIFGSHPTREKPIWSERHCKICNKFLRRGERFACCNQIDKKTCKLCDNHDWTFCREHKYH